jgi:predicted transposase/invertase (TIGR01784 family)
LGKYSFVDEELSVFHTDILYSVDLLESSVQDKKKAYIYLHIEHQSGRNPIISFRVINYCVKILDRYIKNNPGKTLPVIIPLVIYNGKKPFSDSISVFDLFGENKSLAQQYMFNIFHLVDMNTIPDEEIRQYKFSCLLEMILKHIHEKMMMDFLENPAIVSLFKRFIEKNPDKTHIISVVKYINEKANIADRKRFLSWVNKNLPARLEKEIMTLAEQWKSEGIQEGMQQGMQQGQLQGEKIFLKRMLKKRFENIPFDYLKKIEEANAESLLEFGERLIFAKTLEDIFEKYH